MENKKEPLTESERQEIKLRKVRAAKKRRKRIKSIIGWLVVIFIVSLVLTWFLKLKKESEAEIEALKSANNNVEYTVTKSNYVKSIDISGSVAAYDKQEANFRASGAVTSVLVKVGDTVTKDQVLATIDDTSERADLQDIENQITEAKLSGSTKQVELLEMRKSNYEQNLENTTLKANFDGIVSKVDISENNYASAGTAVVTILDLSKMKTTVEIDEIDMQYIELGQTATLTFDSLPVLRLKHMFPTSQWKVDIPQAELVLWTLNLQ